MTRDAGSTPAGLLLLDKPEGPTSHDVVVAARRALRLSRVGHTGTLDPIASGLLVLVLGRATRLAGLLSIHDKIYQGSALLGLATTTYDRTGQPLNQPADVSALRPEDVEAAAAALLGPSLQAPPPFSARKVAGVRLYRRARRGEPIEAPPSQIHVRALRVELHAAGRLAFEAHVSAGTYVRSLIHDVGRALGCGAHVLTLRRTMSGPFRVEDAIRLPDLAAHPEGAVVSRAFLHFDAIPLDLPGLTADPDGVAALRQGRSFEPAPLDGSVVVRDARLHQVRDADGRLLALAVPADEPGLFRPRRVFLDPR